MKKVAIVGGSLAGLELAHTLKGLDQRNDFEVHLFEEHATIGSPLKCAEGFVGLGGVSRPDPNVIENDIRTIDVRFLDDKLRIRNRVHIPTNGRVWVIDRMRNEQRLAACCLAGGVRMHLGRRVRITELQSLFDLIVDASGCPSVSARSRGNQMRVPSIAIGKTVSGDFRGFHHQMLVDFTPLFSGYFWVFPKSRSLANVGLGWHTSGALLQPTNKLLAQYLDTMLGVGAWHQERGVGGCVGTSLSEVLYDPESRVALIGDAAGLANPLLGEGMSNAILSARTLASCLTRDELAAYPDLIRERVGKSRFIGLVGRHMYEQLGHNVFSKTFCALSNPTLDLLEASKKTVVGKLAQHPLILLYCAMSCLAYGAKIAVRNRIPVFAPLRFLHSN